MNLAAVMLYPIVLLLPAVGATEGGHSEDEGGFEVSGTPVEEGGGPYALQEQTWPEPGQDVRGPFTITAFHGGEPESAWQVRVEHRMTIRISPRAERSISPDMFVAMPDRDTGMRLSERKIGKCLPAGSIAGVQPDRNNRLLLFMRDRRVISAELERACRSRDFYSGFYLTRSADGQLCVDRDTLLSRSGMNCRLTRIRQVVEDDR